MSNYYPNEYTGTFKIEYNCFDKSYIYILIGGNILGQ